MKPSLSDLAASNSACFTSAGTVAARRSTGLRDTEPSLARESAKRGVLRRRESTPYSTYKGIFLEAPGFSPRFKGIFGEKQRVSHGKYLLF